MARILTRILTFVREMGGSDGATGNNGIGVAGVNWNVSVVGLKFITAAGSGTTADAIEAIEYATKIGAKLTSNSWGGGENSPTMKAAIEEARDAGILFVAAAGNSKVNNDNNPSYPASYDIANIIAVAATDSADKLASFSNYGVKSVHLAAPGVNVYSTTRNNSFKNMSGTSMAAPHVAGAAALVMAAHPDSSWEEVKAKLLSSVDKVPTLSTKVVSGGRLNLAHAVE